MTELVAGNAERVEGEGRPGFFRVFFLTGFACWLGWLGAAVAIALVSLTGAGVPDDWTDSVPYVASGAGAIGADALSVLFFAVFTVLLTRSVLGSWVEVEQRPAWTWVAVTLLPTAVLAAASPAVAENGGWAIAGIAVRYAAWDRDGRPRPEPLLTPRAARWTAFLLPAVLLAGIAGYALYHPLTVDATSAARIRPGTSPVLVNGLALRNDSGRRLHVLSVEPGRERGYALHLIGVREWVDGMERNGRPPSRAVTSFVIAPHDSAQPLLLQLSRAGCRPGTSGRIETVRVRYSLGGVHTMELPLRPAVTLSC